MACVAFAEQLGRESAASTAAPSCQLESKETLLFESEGSEFRGSDTFSDDAHLQASQELLDAAFSVNDIQPWQYAGMRLERTLHVASPSGGQVDHMIDGVTGEHVAVKRKPNDWISDGQEDVERRHPGAAERPWTDICCTAFLTNVGYPYVCPLRTVYRSEGFTHVVTELATHGDLFRWSTACKEEPGPAREALVLPLAVQVLDAVRRLHDLSLVHGNVCAENLLLSRGDGEDALRVEIIDFGRSSTERFLRGGSAGGKPSCRAPETHYGGVFDGFLADGFASGVVLYTMLMQEYPWISTRSGACKAFEFFRHHGFRAFAARRRCFNRSQTVAQIMSEPVMQLLEGLLCASPSERFTLAESEGLDSMAHTSIWKMPWLRAHPFGR